jgi:hypothetical protein
MIQMLNIWWEHRDTVWSVIVKADYVSSNSSEHSTSFLMILLFTKKNKSDDYCAYPAASRNDKSVVIVYDLVQKNRSSAEKGGVL